MSKEIDTKIECCEIWNSLKDKTKMIDFLINAKTEIDQLKQENETLFLQLSKQEIDEHKPVYCTLAGNDCKYLGKIKELKQQLEEKDKQIDIVSRDNNSYKYNIDEQKRIIYDFAKQLKEKDKEIEELKQQNTLLENENYKLAKELIVKNYKEAQKEVSFGIQLAIQELEKTLNFIENVFDKALKNCSLNNGYYDQILDFIDQQIKELKGE